MTPFDEVFLPIFLLGLLAAATLSIIAGVKSGCLLPGLMLASGTLALWAAIFLGSDMGYRAWQQSPNPPHEAFSDGSALGALLFGWLPAGLSCLLLFTLVRGIRWILRGEHPDASPTVSILPNDARVSTEADETGNPYQSPRF
jgi:hypothetical protein